VVEPTRGERIRTDATTNETSDRGQRRLPLRTLGDNDFEDVVLRTAHRPTRDREIWSQLTAPDLIGRTRDTLTAMHACNSGAMRRKKAALSAFHAECLKTYGGHEAWVQAKADYGSGESVHQISNAWSAAPLPKSTTSGNCGLSSGGVAVFCRPNSLVPSTRFVTTEMPATRPTSSPNRTTWPSGAHSNTSRTPMTP
jgi:hypothetical protein